MSKKDSRQLLVEATQQLLWERGYDGISPKLIQARSKVGHGSMYHHFSSKHDLVLAAIQALVFELTSKVDEIFLNTALPAKKRIMQFFEQQTDMEKGCRLGNLTRDHSIMSDPALRKPIESMFLYLIEQLEKAVQQGLDNNEFSYELNPKELACSLVSFQQGGKVCSKALGNDSPFRLSLNFIQNMLSTL